MVIFKNHIKLKNKKKWLLLLYSGTVRGLETPLRVIKKETLKSPYLTRTCLRTPRAGFEPATNRLTADRSTAELPRNIKNLPLIPTK